MFPILFGLIFAMVFGLAAFFTYGVEGLIHYAWIDYVFWSLILGGVVVSLFEASCRCLPDGLQIRFKRRWLEALNSHNHCID